MRRLWGVFTIVFMIKAYKTLNGEENICAINGCWHDLGHPLKMIPATVSEWLCLLVGFIEGWLGCCLVRLNVCSFFIAPTPPSVVHNGLNGTEHMMNSSPLVMNSSPLVLAGLCSLWATNCSFGFNNSSSSLKSGCFEVTPISRGSTMLVKKINQKFLIREPLGCCGSGQY